MNSFNFCFFCNPLHATCGLYQWDFECCCTPGPAYANLWNLNFKYFFCNIFTTELAVKFCSFQFIHTLQDKHIADSIQNNSTDAFLSYVILCRPSKFMSLEKKSYLLIETKNQEIPVSNHSQVGQVTHMARCLAMGWTAQVQSRMSMGWKFFFTPLCPDWSYGLLSLL